MVAEETSQSSKVKVQRMIIAQLARGVCKKGQRVLWDMSENRKEKGTYRGEKVVEELAQPPRGALMLAKFVVDALAKKQQVRLPPMRVA